MQIALILIAVIVTLITCKLIYRRYVLNQRKRRVVPSWRDSNGMMDTMATQCLKDIQAIPENDRTFSDEFIMDQILHVNRSNQYDRGVDGEGERIAPIMRLLQTSSYLGGTVDVQPIHPLFILDHLENRRPNNRAFKQEINEYRKTLVDVAKQKNKTINEVLDEGIVHTSDPQNVHDSSVNKTLVNMVDRMKGTVDPVENDIAANVQECIDYVLSQSVDAEDRKNLNRAINEVKKGYFNTTFQEREDVLLSLVWLRTKDPINMVEGRSESIKSALIEAVRDMVVNSAVVCSGGRCARILSSLTLLDHDEKLGNPKTVEVMREIIIERTKVILDECIERARQSTYAEMRKIADEYDGKDNGPVDTAILQDFKKDLLDRVDIMLDEYSINLSETDMENIREFCREAILI